jgi:hypothetical protein
MNRKRPPLEPLHWPYNILERAALAIVILAGLGLFLKVVFI